MSDLLNSASLIMIPSGYKEDILYSEIPTNGSGDMAFTRASNGTRINSAGLVEVVAWNLLQQSETFDNAVWGYAQTSVSANATTAPNGTSTADKLKTTTVNASHQLFQSFNNENANHTFSIYAKKGELNYIQLALGNSIEQYANFNLNTGVVGTKGSYCASSSIESVGDGWYRCTAYFNQGTMPTLMVWLTNSASSDWGGIVSWAGANNTDGIYIWGAQLNIGSTAKPYFPTTDRLNVPRLTYQNGGGGCPSLLLEKQSTNLVSYSEQFDNAYWSKYLATVTADNAISPNGTQNADLIYPSSTGALAGQLFRQISSGISSGNVVTVSAFVKASGKNFAYLAEIQGSFNPAAYFNLTTGAITNIIAGVTASMTSFSNGWWRISITSTAGAGSYYAVVGATDSAGSNINTVSGTNGILVYGYQAEVGSYATSYIPTTSSSATRVADACFKTGISSLIGQTEGTVFADVVPFENIVNDVIALNLSVNNSVAITMSNSIIKGLIFNSGNLFIMSGGSYTKGNRYKIAVVYKNNNSKIFVNGALINTDTSNVVFNAALNDLYNYPTNYYEGANNIKFNSTQLYKTALTDAECQALTTI